MTAPSPEQVTEQVTAQGTDGLRSLEERQGNANRRAVKGRVVEVLLFGGMVVSAIPLVLILWQVVTRGAGVISLEFFTAIEPPPRREGGGYAAGFVGTAMMVGAAAAFAVPVGILAAVYLTDYGKGPVAKVIRFFTDVMTGIPSVFVGLAVYGILIVGTPLRFGAFPGAVALSVMMLPIVVRSSEEILKTVDDELRRGAFALGARRWQTTLKVVLPAAGPGLTTGAMLAVARAAGETAPLILTAFGNVNIVTSFFNQAIGAVPLQIYNGARQPFAAGIERSWGGALALLVIVLTLTVIARYIGTRAQRVS